MAFKLEVTSGFKKDLKRIKKRSQADFTILSNFLALIEINGVAAIPPQNRPHRLIGNYKGTWEAHVKPDLLVIWFQYDEEGVIKLVRAGTHSDLF